MKKIILIFSLFLCVSSFGQNSPANGDSSKSIGFPDLKDSASYLLGYNIGQNISQRYVNLNKEFLLKAFSDALDKKISLIEPSLIGTIINRHMTKEGEKIALENIKIGTSFLEENGKKAGVITTASGLQYEILTLGTGAKPTVNDMVKVNYEGRLLDGFVFDGNAKTGQPAQFGVGALIPAWTEILQIMPTGSKFKLYAPSNLAYGNFGNGSSIKPGAMLIFDLELLEIVKQQNQGGTHYPGDGHNHGDEVKPNKNSTTKPVVKPTVKPKTALPKKG